MSNITPSNKIVPSVESRPEPSENKLTKFILEGVGWAGSILVLCPYIVDFEKTLDFALNTLGATGLLIVCIKSKQWQSIVINSAWIIGGIYTYYANA